MTPTYPTALRRLAAEAPDAPALLAETGAVTRANLVAAFDRAVAARRALHLSPQDAVAVEAPAGPAGAQALLAWGAAGPVLPLPPDGEAIPAGAAALVAGPGSARAAVAPIPVLGLDGPAEDARPRADEAPAPPDAATPDVVAFLLGTSGTTGAPKQVGVTHAALAHVAAQLAAAFALTAADRVLNPMPLWHVHGLSIGLVAPLMAGGAVILPPDRLGPAALRLAVERGATWATAMPAILHALAEAAGAEPDLAARLRLRLIRSASAPLPAALRQRVEDRLGAPVLEGYGMTEAASWVTQRLPGDGAPAGSVGRARGLDLRLTGDGEVEIRGPAVISAYRGGAGAAAFRDGWLRTGDLGRLDADGNLTLLGRRSEVIRRGAMQILPRAVEEVLAAQPGVARALVVAHPHPTLTEVPVALVEPSPGADPPEQGLRGALFDRLPPWQVPVRVISVPALPAGATGKPDRPAAARLAAARLAAGGGPPQGPLEALVAALLARHLPDRPASLQRDADFFLVGGDSLSGAQAVAALGALLSVPLAAELLFRAPTPAALAAALTAADDGSIAARLARIAGGVG
jgi:acyl-CoA synthetase (AMP-forming)/AMP-acid ligase II